MSVRPLSRNAIVVFTQLRILQNCGRNGTASRDASVRGPLPHWGRPVSLACAATLG